MPKTTRKPEEINEVRETILQEAIKLMTETGFNNMSMRKLASRLGMTAANIYNYYSNKDELYLDIQKSGFQVLVDIFSDIDNRNIPPINKFREVIKAYIKFSFENASCYDIMFSLNTPKYIDYVQTNIEPLALEEKVTALRAAGITTGIITEILKTSKRIPLEDAKYKTIQLWSTLHGLVSLYNSRVLQELDEDTENIIERYIEDMVNQIA